ncbi:T9SS type A sorting domain-containing protein [Flavobacterium sp. UBA6031]|uniref:T9SS type A sorting domain-containing protein n=1 Tax=Flavobacterium sp. UBA6031 TaxID=1946551 RepID=UPI0025BF8A8C|nr:T9SS type A sorting domain-containing protein [Flavobacterium sp. UBA6031]
MKRTFLTFFLGIIILINSNLFGQDNNCFLHDYQPKVAVIPASVDSLKPSNKYTTILRLKNDTICKVSKYVFGNAVAAWCGSYTDAALINATKIMAPTLIRFPGGTWSDGWFMDKVPTDLPDSVYDGTKYNGVSITKTPKNAIGVHTGTQGGWVTTTDQYYAFRKAAGVSEGLITVNYAYARIGTSKDPVAQAAHEAANWVRYDKGRTKYWEIGNESAGPWEWTFMIDQKTNQDGQPTFITGALYGKHFKVFVDSMKTAAAKIGATIYIGGQVQAAADNGNSQWALGNRTWNQGFFKQVGDSCDFYVVHNYFSNSKVVKDLLTQPGQSIKSNVTYILNDIAKYKAYSKPITLTEYNMGGGAPANVGSSFEMGMQASVLMCEMIKNKVFMGARWYINGMMSGNELPNYANKPRAEFYYLSYLQKYFGDVAISTTSTNPNVLSYASRYSSEETGMVVVNAGDVAQTVSVLTDSIGVGDKYYIYSFTSNSDSAGFSPTVYINGVAPARYQFGPVGPSSSLFTIKAAAYTTDGREIKFTSPGRSLQMITIEKGPYHIKTLVTGVNSPNASSFKLYQNYPNPANSSALIRYELPESVFVTLNVFDCQGRKVTSLVRGLQSAGSQSVQFDASNLNAGVYFYKIDAGQYHDAKKLIIQK